MTAFAEIPTREAAESFAEYSCHFPEFDSLFLRIEAAGFPLGVEGRLRCWVVLSRLSALGVKLTDTAKLAEYLLPVLAGSTHEQTIRRVIEDWAKSASVDSAETVLANAAEEASAPREARELERVDRTGTILAAGLLSLALIGVVALIVAGVLTGSAPDAGTAAKSVVTYSQPIISLDFGLDPFWKEVIEDALSRLSFAVAVLIVGLSFAAWRSELKGRLVRQTEETDLVETFRLTAKIPEWFRTADARTAFDRLKRVRLFDTDLIDVPETISRSSRSGGLPLVANKRQRELPNYVLLVDRAGLDDLAGIFARAVEAALIDARIVYSRYDFSGGLDRLNPVRGGARADIVDAEYLPFSVVSSRHAGERLILIGTGTGFFEVPGFRYDRSGRRTLVRLGTPLPETVHIREFGAAGLITPAPVSAWGENERRLRELGFEIFSADVDGIRNLAAQLMSEPGAVVWTSPRSQTDEDQFLLRLDRDATRLSSRVPPRGAEIDRLVRNLKVWGGNAEVYILLAAIAAFPKIDSTFTFVLARMLLGKEMDSALFARLIRLPWIRGGYMPDWLRIAIVNGLDPEQRESVQAIQMAMLRGAEQAQEEGKKFSLDQLVANFQVAREYSRGNWEALISRIQPRSILSADERIFFSVLRDYKLDPELDVIRPEAPEIVAEMIDAPERRRRAQIRAATIGLAAVTAVLQPWIWMLLTTAGQTADWALRLASSIFPPMVISPNINPAMATFLLVLAMTLWLVNVTRHEPIVFFKYSWQTVFIFPWQALRQSVRQIVWDPRLPAFYAMLAALIGLITHPRTTPDASDLNFVTDVFLLTAGGVVSVWVSAVTSKHWWNALSADSRLETQARHDPVTATLGCLLVVATWAVPWFLAVLPAAANQKNTLGILFYAGSIGTASWVVSSALARRWLIGEASTGPLDRLWLDAGFALTVFLVVTSFNGALELFITDPDNSWLATALGTAAAAIYSLQLKATLGLRKMRPVWGPLINGAVTGMVITWAGVMGLASFDTIFNIRNEYLLLSLPALVGGIAFGAVAVFQFRRSDYPGGASLGLRAKGAILGGVFLVVATNLGYALFNAVQAGVSPRRGDFAVVLLCAVLPASLAIWPMFRVLAPAFRTADSSLPRWRIIADSPWWGTLAMWPVCIVWQIGGMSFSVWPVALLIAIVFWYRHGERALVPIAVGSLPLLVRLGDINTSLYTPGGLWPAIAIFFLARFAADETFRQRLLRREHLSWPEAFLIVALLMVNLEISLGTFGEISSLVERTAIAASIHVDSSWMLVAAALAIGASRMPLSRFAVAVITAWPVSDIPSMLNGSVRSATFIGLLPGEVATALLVLYGARAWRMYAAGVRLQYMHKLTGLLYRSLAQMKMRGILLSTGAAVAVGIISSGWIPVVEPAGIDAGGAARDNWTFAPSPAGTLALVMLTGLIAGNLWVDRFATSKLLALRLAYVPLGVVVIYIMTAQAIGSIALASLRRDMGVTGFSVCVIAFLVFGIGARIVAERRGGERFWESARRLWIAPKQSGPTTESPVESDQSLPLDPNSKRQLPA